MVFIGPAHHIESTKAALAKAIGYYHERPAASFLQGTFAFTWIHRIPEASATPIIVTPDGAIDLQWIGWKFRVAGPDKEPMIEMLPAGTTVIGFRFQPAAAAAWLGVPANEILGERLYLHELLGPSARQLAGKVRDNRNIAELTAELESVIADFAPRNAAIAQSMRAAYNLIQAGPPPGVALVPWLGRALAMSERTLRRRFDESFGYGPKTLDRILRYQRYLHLVRLSQESTASLAVRAGYSDQPHLVRESQRLACCTPLEVERIMKTGSGRDER
jgi:AraC-like DNA-binding protein